jgi:hypothetical protein
MSNLNRPMVILVVLAAMLVSMACSLSSIVPNLGGEDATATPEVAVLVPTGPALPTEPGKATVQAKPTLAAETPLPASTGAPQIADVQAGLDTLDSYRLNYNMTVTGKDPKGADAKQELKLLQETVKSKASLHTVWGGSGWAANKNPSSFEIFQIGKTSYMLTPAKDTTPATCMSFSNDKPAFDQSQLLTPNELMGGLQGGALVARGEMVNGVKADHYKLLKANLGFGVTTAQVGDMWLAQDGGFLVKFVGQADGDFSLSADQIKGTVVWDYNLTQINQLKEIVLPAECLASAGAIQDLPVPPNATNQSSFGEIVTFNSPDAPKVVADFFRKELPGKGWKITSDSNLGTVVIMAIQKDTRKFSIMITPGQGDQGTAVVITKAP